MTKILIVEDNELNLKLLRDLFETQGFEVHEAVTGPDGLRLAAELQPDLIVLDIQLPGMDGLSVARSLKADPATKAMPILALTAYAMRQDEEAALRSGCDAYVPKPIRTREFLAKVKSMLEAGKPPRHEDTKGPSF